jgi:hypothetical protein
MIFVELVPRFRVYPSSINGLIARATAQTEFVWKNVDLYGSAQTRAISPFMEGGCMRSFIEAFLNRGGSIRSTPLLKLLLEVNGIWPWLI